MNLTYSASIASLLLAGGCVQIVGIDPGHLAENGGAGASVSSTSADTTTNATTSALSSTTGVGGAGGAGCAPPALSYLQSGDIRFVADDLTPAIIAAGWKAHATDPTLLVDGPTPPLLVPNAFGGCHQGVEVGYSPTGNRWLHSAKPPSSMSDPTHTIAVVVSVVDFDALNAGGPQVPGVVFLSGINAQDQNSEIGFDVTSPTHGRPWFGGYGETAFDGSPILDRTTVYVLVKVSRIANGLVEGYTDSVLDTQATLVAHYNLNDDIGIGGSVFSSNEVQATNGLVSRVAEVIVMHRALDAADVKTLSCDLSNAYGGGPLNCL